VRFAAVIGRGLGGSRIHGVAGREAVRLRGSPGGRRSGVGDTTATPSPNPGLDEPERPGAKTPADHLRTMAVSFGLFGTLVDADLPDDPAAAIGDELRARGVRVPDDWARAFAAERVDAPEGAAVPLPARVARALRSRGVAPSDNAPRRAVVSAFDPEVRTRSGAVEAVAAARDRGPVGLLANAPAPELVGRVLVRADLAREEFDAVVTSVACGWRKPDRRAFETVADRLGTDPADLTHVGTPARGGRGVRGAGGRFVPATEALERDGAP
jgi:FMN phosphatase YigB (HAD superfamily)